jgi:threonine dehydratase
MTLPRYAVQLADIEAAAARIRPFVHRTPVMTCETLNRLAGRKLFFKCENFQKTGSFKYRGATNAIQKLSDTQASRGVVTHSSGNHAQAIALAGRVRGIPASIVMPHTAAAIKKQAVLDYGGMVVECEPNLAAREATAQEIVERTGGVLIPPFDHADVIAGQGTAALELLEERPDLDAIIVPVGGGGLISGFTIAAKGVNESLLIYGAEPAAADDAARSKAGGVWVSQPPPKTIADGLMTSLGQLTWPIVRDRVDAIHTVSEDQIAAAMRLVWERMKIIIEPSAGVGVAVALSDEFRAMYGLERVGVVLCGGNVNLDKLYW